MDVLALASDNSPLTFNSDNICFVTLKLFLVDWPLADGDSDLGRLLESVHLNI